METKKKVLTCLSLFCTLGLMAQQPHMIELWPGNVPGATKAKQAPVTDTKTEAGVTLVTEVTNPTLAVYTPEGEKNGIGIIVCPGGGYRLLAYDKEGTDIAQWLTKQGFTVFVLAYRVPGQQKGALQDIQRAIRLVRAEHKELNKVGVIGFSAGAHLSARAATCLEENIYPKIDRADELSCRPDFAMLIYPAYLDGGECGKQNPELTVTSQTPPMFIFGTSDDSHGGSALVMTQALRDHQVPVELHFMAVGGHGYGMRSETGLIWSSLAETWLKGF